MASARTTIFFIGASVRYPVWARSCARRIVERLRAPCRSGRGRARPRARGPVRAAVLRPRGRRAGRCWWCRAGWSGDGRPPVRARARPAASAISVTRPIACASCASIVRPVRIRSSARPVPTIRGSRCVPPSISGTPQRRSAQPNVAVVVATRRSHHSASSKPPARQWPLIAAIVGFGDASRVNPSGPPGASGSSVSSAFRSAPAQNAWSPAPVSTSTCASSSAAKRLKASSSACAVGPSIALWRSGRSIVTSAAWSRRS